jgi:peptidoglycan biosynthesis protein MviN/MurJ (putative lipid II flippase)
VPASDAPPAPAAAPTPPQGTRVGTSVALTAVSAVATMATGGILALLIAARFGSTEHTDGFFAAYGVFGIVVLVAQSTRLTLVGRLVGAARDVAALTPWLRTAAVLWLVCGVVFLLIGWPLAGLLTATPAARSSMREALAVLWPAAGGQLLASLAAAMLGVLGDYTKAAAAYLAGSVIAIVAFTILAGRLEVRAIPVALVIGAATTAVPLAAALRRRGWRPGRPVPAGAGAAAGERIATVLLGAVQIAVPQVLYLISMGFAATIGTGVPTEYSYAYFGLGLVSAATASSVSVVLAAPLAATWDRDPASLRPHVRDCLRVGLVLLAPVAGLAALVGDDVGRVVLGDFSPAEVGRTIDAFLGLLPAAVAAQLTAIPLVALYGAGRHRLVAAIALPVVALHVVLSALLAGTDDLTWLAVAASASTLVLASLVYVVLHGAAAPRELAWALGEVLLVGVPAAACFGVPALLLGDWPAAALGLVLFAGAVAVGLPAHRALALRIARIGR